MCRLIEGVLKSFGFQKVTLHIGGCCLSPSSPSFELFHLQTPDWLKCLNVSQGEQLQCTAHTWLSPRHVLVAAEKGKVIHDDDDEDAEDVNDDSEGEDDFTAN